MEGISFFSAKERPIRIMSLKKLLGVFSGLSFALSMFGENPRFDAEGKFLFFFTDPVKDMLNERLCNVQKSPEQFSFNQDRFEELVNKTNEWGWCELQDNEKQEIVECLLYVNDVPTKENKDFLLSLLEALRDINDDNLITFCPSDRDTKVYSYIDSVYVSIE